MILYAADLCEQLPYSSTLISSTWAAKPASYNARPPVASPSQDVKRERDNQMTSLLVQAIQMAAERGDVASRTALANFESLLQLLPQDLPITDPYITESGSICLDWDENPDCQLSVLLKDRGQVAFSAYFSGEKVNGSTRFSGLQLPDSLLAVAKRWASGNRARHAT